MQPPTGLGTGPWTGTPALWSVSSPEAQTSPGRCCSSPGCPAEAAGTSDHPVPESRTASCQAVGAGAAGVGGGDPPSSAPGRPALTMEPRAVLPLSFWAELRADGEDREEDGGVPPVDTVSSAFGDGPSDCWRLGAPWPPSAGEAALGTPGSAHCLRTSPRAHLKRGGSARGAGAPSAPAVLSALPWRTWLDVVLGSEDLMVPPRPAELVHLQEQVFVSEHAHTHTRAHTSTWVRSRVCACVNPQM